MQHNERIFIAPRISIRQPFETFIYSINSTIRAYLVNPQARQLTGGLHFPFKGSESDLLLKAVTELHRYALVGVTKELNRFFESLAEHMNINQPIYPERQNTNDSLQQVFSASYTQKPTVANSQDREHLLRLNTVDLVLYEMILRRWDQSDCYQVPPIENEIRWCQERLATLQGQRVENAPVGNYLARSFKNVFTRWLKANEVTDELIAFSTELRHDSQRQSALQFKSIQGFEALRDASVIETLKNLITAEYHQNTDCLLVAHADQTSAISKALLDHGAHIRRVRFSETSVDFALEESKLIVEEFDELNKSHTDLFQSLNGHVPFRLPPGVCLSRSEEYLKHRYFMHPEHGYYVFVVSSQDCSLEAAVLVLRLDDLKALYLCDFWGDWAHIKLYLNALSCFFKQSGSVCIRGSTDLLDCAFNDDECTEIPFEALWSSPQSFQTHSKFYCLEGIEPSL